MIKKIMLLPLDERPCNYDFTGLMMGGTDFELLKPPKQILSHKKESGDADKIWEWVVENAAACYGAILSVDTLVYTGILPSRLHNLDTEILLARLERLRLLKKQNPGLKLFGFSLIMRCPQYSSSDEEPDYYEEWGREIFRWGDIGHRLELSIATEEEKAELEDITARLPQAHLWDYLERRKKNLIINKRAIELTRDGIFDFLIIPQDDSSPYGLTAKDQQIVRRHIQEMQQQFCVYMYPDADAVENTLAARLINEANDKRPLVYVKYASALGDAVTPVFEDRLINETIKYQIMAAGGLPASCVSEADIVLMINMPSGNLLCHDTAGEIPHTIAYDVNRNQIEQVEFAEYAMNTLHKEVCFGDVAYGNGGDPELFELLRIKGLLFRISGYAGWNTSSNTLGTCIPMSMLHLLYGDRQAHLDFLALRYVEDIGYMAYVRKEICEHYLEKLGGTYFAVDGERGRIATLIRDKLQEFADREISNDTHKISIIDCYQPWNRMFETAPTVRVEKKKDKRIFVC